ncbi:MAG: efflux RND transporter periplasmic adaptor subunit [Mariprofundus sp.]
MKTVVIGISMLALLMGAPVLAAEHGHDEGDGHTAHEEGGHAGHEEGGAIKLTPAQIQQAGIAVEILQPRPKMQAVSAPGAVAFNAYALADITTQVDAVVDARHVHLGDRVKKDQKLVTLNSTSLAQVQASYLRARAEHSRSSQELARLKKLAQQKIISQARLQQADSTYRTMRANLAAAKATLFSYGMNQHDISALLKQEAYGLLTLRAPHAGTVVADDFRLGQHVAAGSRLMQVADESRVWVEVKIPESVLSEVRVGQTASVTPKGAREHYSGTVINIHHQLDAVTRTAGVRLSIENRDDLLHPGMFVNAEIAIGTDEKALLLPEQAVQRQGSELIVFVEEESGHFERREVTVGKINMGLLPVLGGVKAGELVVVKGAFVLASELAKAGFEVHNH